MTQKTGFGNLPKKYCSFEYAKVAVIPAPYDRTSTWIKGADKGPEAIIEALAGPPLNLPTKARAKSKKYLPPPAKSNIDPKRTNKKTKITDTEIGIPKMASPPNQ